MGQNNNILSNNNNNNNNPALKPLLTVNKQQ